MSAFKHSTKGRKDVLRARSRRAIIQHLSFQPVAKKVDVSAIKSSFADAKKKTPSKASPTKESASSASSKAANKALNAKEVKKDLSSTGQTKTKATTTATSKG